eukprot:tig00020902_g14945.t1
MAGHSLAHFDPPKALLSFSGLSYSFGGRKELLRDVTGFVRSGDLLALMGPSGGGKTTLLDVLADRKTGGSITGELLIVRPAPLAAPPLARAPSSAAVAITISLAATSK